MPATPLSTKTIVLGPACKASNSDLLKLELCNSKKCRLLKHGHSANLSPANEIMDVQLLQSKQSLLLSTQILDKV